MPNPVVRLALSVAATAALVFGAGCTPMGDGPESSMPVSPSTAVETTSAATDEPTPSEVAPSETEPADGPEPIGEWVEVPIPFETFPAMIGDYEATDLGDFSVYAKNLADGTRYLISPVANETSYTAADFAALFDEGAEEFREELVPGSAFCGIQYTAPACFFDSEEFGVVSVRTDSAPWEDVVLVTQELLGVL